MTWKEGSRSGEVGSVKLHSGFAGGVRTLGIEVLTSSNFSVFAMVLEILGDALIPGWVTVELSSSDF